jgi:hypothetical protein
MSDQWQYQLRLYLPEGLVDVARSDPDNSTLNPLPEILAKHDAAIRCQFDAFAGYVAEAEKHGTEGYSLYAWTKATIEDPVKKVKHLRSFAIHVKGREVYGKEEADALEADLQPIVGGSLITRISKHDTNPASNPQPPEQYRSRKLS